MKPSLVSISVVSFIAMGSFWSTLFGVHSLSIRNRYVASEIELFPSASIPSFHICNNEMT